ncbi:MAG: ABC transporter substrate-binding protein [Gammaproteobacteria bacterium]|nr:ABC transporter substrate-binding protein [Gammaproteobacteria bacterium]
MRYAPGLILLLAASVAGVVEAQPYPFDRPGPFRVPYQAEQQGPAAILNEGLKKLQAFARQDERPSREAIALFLDQEVAPYFDFAYMAKWAGGRAWRHLGPERQAELEQTIKIDFLSTLAQRLAGYDGQQVRIIRTRRGSGNEVSVMVGILNPGSYPAQLEFRFYRSSRGWKVFDVSANGSSVVMHYRSEFNRMMRPRPGRGGYYPGR